MGLGSRFSYKINKMDETTPGPGTYTNIEPSSISRISQAIRSSRSNPRAAFGVDRETSAKVQHHGMERHFLGRYGADPGTYDMPDHIGKSSKGRNINDAGGKSDRGLLPLSEERARLKASLYKNSHQ